jgi:hypothetical protein
MVGFGFSQTVYAFCLAKAPLCLTIIPLAEANGNE